MNQKWSGGYVSDIPYSHGYYHELSPPFLRFALLLNGLAHGGGDPRGEYTYCELGYGQGVSANLHAAANPRGRFWGTDFNPDHALFARRIAQEAGLDAQWLACGFEELLERDLPQFDFITLHGVWSWVDPQARHAIVEFIRRRLKVGGVVYISYNVMPGWSAEKPLRDLLWMHSQLSGSQGDSTTRRIQGAVDFARRLRKGRADYFEHNPRAGAMLDDLQRDDVHVVAHEYFNESWFITYFADLARSLEGAGLGFACSVHKSDLAGLVRERKKACGLADLDLNPALRETTHDFLLDRRFRRDVFVRGAERLTPAEREARLRAVGLVLLCPADRIQPVVGTPYGSVSLDPDLCHALAAPLAQAHGPVALGALMEAAGLAHTPIEPVIEVVGALVTNSTLAPVFPDDMPCEGRARAMNLAIARRAPLRDDLRYLACPATGRAIEVAPGELLFLRAWEEGARTVPALAQAVQDAAPPAQSPGDAQAAARDFLEHVAPQWRRLGLLPENAA